MAATDAPGSSLSYTKPTALFSPPSLLFRSSRTARSSSLYLYLQLHLRDRSEAHRRGREIREPAMKRPGYQPKASARVRNTAGEPPISFDGAGHSRSPSRSREIGFRPLCFLPCPASVVPSSVNVSIDSIALLLSPPRLVPVQYIAQLRARQGSHGC